MNSTMSILIASDQEREEVFAEIWQGEEEWGEVSFSGPDRSLIIRIFPPRSGEPHVFRLDEVQAILEEARRKLVGEGPAVA